MTEDIKHLILPDPKYDRDSKHILQSLLDLNLEAKDTLSVLLTTLNVLLVAAAKDEKSFKLLLKESIKALRVMANHDHYIEILEGMKEDDLVN
jgi:hypothetical protein